MLAQLCSARSEGLDARCEALLGEPSGDFVEVQRARGGRSVDDAACALGGEIRHGLAAASFGQEAKGLQRQGVIVLVAGGATFVGQREDRTRSATASSRSRSVGRALARLD